MIERTTLAGQRLKPCDMIISLSLPAKLNIDKTAGPVQGFIQDKNVASRKYVGRHVHVNSQYIQASHGFMQNQIIASNTCFGGHIDHMGVNC